MESLEQRVLILIKQAKNCLTDSELTTLLPGVSDTDRFDAIMKLSDNHKIDLR